MTELAAPFGNTPQGNATNNLYNAVSSITGSGALGTATAAQAGAANLQGQLAPSNLSNVAQGLYQQSGVTGLESAYGDLSSIFPMWLADQNLASKYANPSMLGPGQTPTQATYLQSPDQIAAQFGSGLATGGDFKGFSTPSANTSAIGAVPTATANMLSLINGAIGAEQGNVGTVMGNYTGDIQTRVQQLLNAAGIASGLYNDQVQAAQLNAPGTFNFTYQQAQNVEADAKKGMTLGDLMLKYNGLLDPNSIYDTYNKVHASDKIGSKGSTGWGPAKESAEQLAQWGVTGAPLTQTANASKPAPTKTIGGQVFEYNPKTKAYDIPAGGTKAINQSTAMLDEYLAKWKAMNPIEKSMPSQITTALPGAFPDRAYLDTDFFTQIEPLLRKQVVGGRITQQEMTWLKNSLPKAGDTDQSAANKIQAIKDALSGGIGNAAGTNYNGGTSDPLGIL